MKQVYVVIARHEQKEGSIKPELLGHAIDRTVVFLSGKGRKNAYELGGKEFSGKDISKLVVVTSDFIITQQTADAILEGAGYDPEELRGRADVARFLTDSRIGLSGSVWKDIPGIPGYGEEPEQLNPFINGLLGSYSLPDVDDPYNAKRMPVMAQKAVGVADGLLRGLEDLSESLRDDQKGAVLVVTHVPPLDAFAAFYDDHMQFVDTGETRSDGRKVYHVGVVPPVKAHIEGQYMNGVATFGKIHGQGSVHDLSRLVLNVRGSELACDLKEFVDDVSRLRHLAANGLQVRK